MPKNKRVISKLERVSKHISRAIKSGKLSQREVEKLLGKEKEAQKDDTLEALLKVK